MNIRRFAALFAATLLLGACAAPPSGPAPAPGPANVHPGFDTRRYPGEAAMRAWRESSPYRWVGYYLTSPCHRNSTWTGTRPTLERLGWGMAILYVGQQVFEGQSTENAPGTPIVCSRTLLTAERGRADAQDAIRQAEAEGFRRGSTIFLDVERMQTVPPEMRAYYGAWIEEMLRDGRFLPGTYAHRQNAADLYAVAQPIYVRAGRTERLPFWISGGSGFSLTQAPTTVGMPFAEVWQGALDVDRTWGGITLRIDENVANRPSPSGGA